MENLPLFTGLYLSQVVRRISSPLSPTLFLSSHHGLATIQQDLFHQIPDLEMVKWCTKKNWLLGSNLLVSFKTMPWNPSLFLKAGLKLCVSNSNPTRLPETSFRVTKLHSICIAVTGWIACMALVHAGLNSDTPTYFTFPIFTISCWSLGWQHLMGPWKIWKILECFFSHPSRFHWEAPTSLQKKAGETTKRWEDLSRKKKKLKHGITMGTPSAQLTVSLSCH